MSSETLSAGWREEWGNVQCVIMGQNILASPLAGIIHEEVTLHFIVKLYTLFYLFIY